MMERLISRFATLAATLMSPHPAWQGMDRQARKLMTLMQKVFHPDIHAPADLRRMIHYSASLWNIPAERFVHTRDEVLTEDLSLRWYFVEGEEVDKEKQQGLVYFHGGGMVVGDLDSHDRLCRRIARIRRMTVVAVNYRLAPEHPFPAGAEDAITAWNHVAGVWEEQEKNIKHLGIGGDGSGGYLATMVCQQYVDSTLSIQPDVMPAWQWLVCPVTDCRDRSSDSWVTCSQDLLFTSKLLGCFHDAYVPDRKNHALPAVSPASAAKDVLAQLPAAAVITAEYDSLRDQGSAYAELLRSAGVAVIRHHEEKLPHGFIHLGGFSEAAFMGVDKAIARIDMLCLQARRTLPVNAPQRIERVDRV